VKDTSSIFGRARLGELLVADGLLTVEQCQQALHAQVIWGGRLGTCLIELGFVGLDALSLALGRQLRHPAALARHFESADRHLQRCISIDTAAQHACVPLVRIGGGNKTVVAATAPLDDAARAQIAGELAVDPEGLLVSVAVELRIRYQLERVYGIPRDTRFLRPNSALPTTFPRFEVLPVASIGSDLDMPTAPILDRGSVEALLAVTRPRARRNVTPPPTVIASDDRARERRHFVHTLADEPARVDRGTPQKVGFRRLAIGTDAMGALARSQSSSLDEATRTIARADDRTRVSELVLEAIARFMPSAASAMLMFVRGGIAVSSAGFSRAGAALPEIAVPIDQPSMVMVAIEHNAPARAGAGELGSTIDQRLLHALGALDGDLVVVPVAVADQVLGLLVMAASTEQPLPGSHAIANAAGLAFARLMRDASRR